MRTYGIHELGFTEVIDKDVAVAQNEYTDSFEVPLEPKGRAQTGQVAQFLLRTTELDLGAVLAPDGVMVFFDADPGLSAGDTTMTGAKMATIIGEVAVAAADWTALSDGAFVTKTDINLRYHELQSLFAVWFHTDATGFNSAGTDDEELHINIWIQPITVS